MPEIEHGDEWNTGDSLLHHVPNSVAGWKLTDADTTTAEWWRRGSTYASDKELYSKLRVYHTGGAHHPRWSIGRWTYNKFGIRISGGGSVKSFTYLRGDDEAREEKLEYAISEAVDIMETYPGKEEFESKPSFPKTVGRWENVARGSEEYGWKLGELSVFASFSEMNGKSELYKVGFYDGNREYVVSGTATITDAIDSVVSFMGAVPEGNVRESELYEALTSVKGVGDVWAVKLMVSGVDESCVSQLEYKSPSRVCRDSLKGE